MGDEETVGPGITCSPLASHLVKQALRLRCARPRLGAARKRFGVSSGR